MMDLWLFSGMKLRTKFDTISNLRRELDEVEKIYEENRHDFDELKKLHPTEHVEDKNRVAV